MHSSGVLSFISADLKSVEKGDNVGNFYSFTVENYDVSNLFSCYYFIIYDTISKTLEEQPLQNHCNIVLHCIPIGLLRTFTILYFICLII